MIGDLLVVVAVLIVGPVAGGALLGWTADAALCLRDLRAGREVNR